MILVNFLTNKVIDFIQKLKILKIQRIVNQGYNLVTKYKKADYICIDSALKQLVAKIISSSPEIYKKILSKN